VRKHLALPAQIALSTALLFAATHLDAAPQAGGTAKNAAPPHRQKLLYREDFRLGLDRWKLELEKPGRITTHDGILDIDVPAGATLWFRPKLKGPVLIEYEAKAVARGGENDRVSDLNCFWMATDPQHPDDIFAVQRHGAFAEYNSLLTYYVGLGGNGNTTTRFRRYIGSPTERPLLPQNDLSDRKFLLQQNKKQKIRLLADGDSIAFYRDAERIFSYTDTHPFTQGWFALRTTKSHIEVSHLRIYQVRAIAHVA
jgi:hypothetical protein